MAEQLDLGADDRLNAPGSVVGSAEFSPCGRYRYTLERTWDRHRPRICWLALNPSSAGANPGTDEDPTSRKFAGFARRLGAGGYIAVNMFALVSTEPRGLLDAIDPVGPGNNDAIAHATHYPSRLVLCAWGAPSDAKLKKLLAARVKAVLGVIKNRRELWCLGTCKDGEPRHPLYLSWESEPKRWSAP